MIHWMLEEVGAPYRYELVNLQTGDHKKPDFLAVNPMGKIPAILHRGVTVTECAAICAYLADAFPAAQLAPPADSLARGTYYRWLFFGAGCVEPAIIDRLLQRPVPSGTHALGYGSYQSTVASLESALTPGPFLLGTHFSAADVYIGAQIAFGLQGQLLEPRAVFVEYSERLRQRPAHQRFMQQNDRIAAQMQGQAQSPPGGSP